VIGASMIPPRSVPQQDSDAETRLQSLVPGSADVRSGEGEGKGARRDGDFVLGDVVAKPETCRTPFASPVEAQMTQELVDMDPHTLGGWFRPACWEHHDWDDMVLDLRPSEEDRVHS
jgi:hypothetical protein